MQKLLFKDLRETQIQVNGERKKDSYIENSFEINEELDRSIISFQESKNHPVYRWFKYKEGFSSTLVRYCIEYAKSKDLKINEIFDPFSGTATTLISAYEMGLNSTGIEVLPVANAIAKARKCAFEVDAKKFRKYIEKLEEFDLNKPSDWKFPHIRITKGAFPLDTEDALSAYQNYLEQIDDENIRYLFWFANLAILEKISYTRKDGQYLRWDRRARRKLSSKFEKNTIYSFEEAIKTKLNEIEKDFHKFQKTNNQNKANYTLNEGSVLNILPKLDGSSFDLVVTSPPYCNRYDYTRTYALELAFMSYSNDQVKDLRQKLLSATVENRSKQKSLKNFYSNLERSDVYQEVIDSYKSNTYLQDVLEYLKIRYENDELNNKNILRMVKNYFLEMAFVIYELSRVVKDHGYVFMVNDNVRYAGKEVPVDLILSTFAEKFGFGIDKIWVLSRGKGNSSQQMGTHGRKELRKCVYVWKK